MPSDNSKLIATAAGAAVAGAALAVAAMTMVDNKKEKGGYPREPGPQRPHRPSVVMNDSSHDASLSRDNDSLLFPHNHEEKMRRRIATRYTIEEENNTPRDSVTVRVPATSANVGPGCKCCGYHLKVFVVLYSHCNGGTHMCFYCFGCCNDSILLPLFMNYRRRLHWNRRGFMVGSNRRTG